LISAWKSGRNPSANNEMNKTTNPIHSYFLSSSDFTYGSKYLKIKIPKEATIPTTIFCLDSLSFLSVTLEHKIPTKITDKRLHDFNVATIG
jgi:hypothetical protein